MTPKTDTIWGIERTPWAENYGELAVERIVVWEAPLANNDDTVFAAGHIPHNTEVEVLSKRTVAKRRWFKVRGQGFVMPDLKKISRAKLLGRKLKRLAGKEVPAYEMQPGPVEGWVLSVMLKDRGATDARKR